LCSAFEISVSFLNISVIRPYLELDITREDVEKAHWKEVGLCLKTLFGSSTDYTASRELTELADFLTKGAVT